MGLEFSFLEVRGKGACRKESGSQDCSVTVTRPWEPPEKKLFLTTFQGDMELLCLTFKTVSFHSSEGMRFHGFSGTMINKIPARGILL